MTHPADDLIAAWLADDLDAEGVRALEEQLRNDPTARTRFAHFCQGETVLAQALAVAPVRPGTTGLRRAVRAGSRRMRPRRPAGRFGWVLPVMAAAALVAVVVVVGMTRSAPESAAVVTPAGPLELISVGDRLGDPVLSDGRPLRVGMSAPRGAVVEIRALDATFRWRDGTLLTAVGGTTLRVIDGEAAVQLLGGRALEAQVTKRTVVPFRIDAPHATATVMGTHFAIGGNQDATVLVVKEGRVRFSANGMVREVIAGETVVADAKGLQIEKEVQVLGFVPTAHQVTRILGPRLITRGTLRVSDLPADGINLRIDCPPEVRSVRAGMRGVGNPRLEQVRDFFVFGDVKNRATTAWKPNTGTFLVDAQPYADVDGRQPLGPPVTFELTIAP